MKSTLFWISHLRIEQNCALSSGTYKTLHPQAVHHALRGQAIVLGLAKFNSAHIASAKMPPRRQSWCVKHILQSIFTGLEEDRTTQTLSNKKGKCHLVRGIAQMKSALMHTPMRCAEEPHSDLVPSECTRCST
eukprot:182510-Pelagomonas_calceolata.AAC.3